MPTSSDLGNASGGLTGRYLVLFTPDTNAESAIKTAGAAGIRLAHPLEYGEGDFPAAFEKADGVYFDELQVAVVRSAPEEARQLGIRDHSSRIIAVEPERYVYAISSTLHELPHVDRRGAEYLQGYRDGVDHIMSVVSARAQTPLRNAPALRRWTDDQLTWGIHATGADHVAETGRGVRVAILDTGFDLTHPDFSDRTIVTQSFVKDEDAQDHHGHGTHCVGTSCGPRSQHGSPGHGVACNAEIYAGKVLGNSGAGTDSSILAGINWAIAQNCRIISMSLGAPSTGAPYSRVYEAIAKRALARNTLIVAAAGNESQRPYAVRPVGHPADCPSIMAVAAIDQSANVAYFSCQSGNAAGAEVDIAAPGVDVLSSWIRPKTHNTISGTSMATPHVAGIAALYLEREPALTASDLWQRLVSDAEPLTGTAIDVGAGLVHIQ